MNTNPKIVKKDTEIHYKFRNSSMFPNIVIKVVQVKIQFTKICVIGITAGVWILSNKTSLSWLRAVCKILVDCTWVAKWFFGFFLRFVASSGLNWFWYLSLLIFLRINWSPCWDSNGISHHALLSSLTC